MIELIQRISRRVLESRGKMGTRIKLMSESGELISELGHEIEGRGNKDLTRGEIQDVLILCYAVAIDHGLTIEDLHKGIVDKTKERFPEQLQEKD